VYAPCEDRKTKNDHFREMFLETAKNKNLPGWHSISKNILFDSWYGSVANLKTIHSQGWTFFTTQQGALL
jgi:hypothetical protein